MNEEKLREDLKVYLKLKDWEFAWNADYGNGLFSLCDCELTGGCEKCQYHYIPKYNVGNRPNS